MESCIKRERSSRVSVGAGNKRASRGRGEGLILPKEKEDGEQPKAEGCRRYTSERAWTEERGINGDAAERD